MRDRPARPGATTSGGGRGIRTLGGVSPTAVFKTAAIGHSAIPPAFETGLARAGFTVPALRGRRKRWQTRRQRVQWRFPEVPPMLVLLLLLATEGPPGA